MKWKIGTVGQTRFRFTEGEADAVYKSLMTPIVEQIVETVLDDVRGATKSPRVRDSYYVEPFFTPNKVGVNVGNRWPYWHLQEFNTNLGGYWPPHGPGSRLEYWAAMHNISAYYVAWLIHLRGTKGNYTFTNIWRLRRPWVRSNLVIAHRQVVAYMLGQGYKP